MIKPGRTFFIIMICFLFLGTSAFFFNELYVFWIFSGLLLLPVISIDAIMLSFFTDRLHIERKLNSTLTLGREALVRLNISLAGKNRFIAGTAKLFDLYPDSIDCSVFPVKLNRKLFKKMPKPGQNPRNAFYIFEYPVIPIERGNWEFSRTELLLGSFLGFWQFKVIHPCVSRGRTFPDFRKLTSGAELRGILEQTGIKVIRKRGQGMEFMSLRDYQKGDSVKAIDWRATGRRNKPIVREYQEEQDQQVLLLLDSGYRLNRLEYSTGPSGDSPLAEMGGVVSDKNSARTPGTFLRTQFDSALEAALLLSWVALKHSDGVALGCFGTEERWLPPRKGMSALSGIIRSLYDVKCDSTPSSLFSALESALARLKRRTFIVMISNFREEDGESLGWILRRIQRRHLLLLVSLKEMEAEKIAKRKPAGTEEALETAAAFSYLSARRRLYKTWEHLGLLTLECNSRELGPALINRYLEVKRSGLL
ncbi:MAG: DUF58 domain-containing protein [Treponema sp.]|nr:DUF58 domain-containing protein [Treponema sp.]